MVISIIAIIVIIGIPGLLKARVNSNHAMIESDLRTFSSIIEMYRAQQSSPIDAPDIAVLTVGATPDLDNTWDIANAAPGKHSDTFTYSVTANGATYSMLAAPISTNGVNTYYMDQTGILVGGSSRTALTGLVMGCSGGVPIA